MNCSTKTVIVLFLLLLVGSFPITAIDSNAPEKHMALADVGKGLPGWFYRRNVTITGSAGAGANYQVLINVTYDSDMQTNFSDLRFTDNDGGTQLDYWIQDYTDSSFALVWVEVTDNLDSAQLIYMYYGNPDVSTTSDADDTFLFFDDFEDGTLNKWDVTTACSIVTDRVSSGTYSVYLASAANLEFHFGSGLTHGIAVNLDFNIENTLRGITCNIKNDVAEITTYARTYETDTSPMYHFDGGWKTWPLSTDIYDDDTWYVQYAGFDQDSGDPDMRLWVDGDYQGEEDQHESDDTDWEAQNIRDITFGTQASYPGWMDNVWVRKWVVTEPVPTVGDEELAPNWQQAGSGSIVFIISRDEWGFNTGLIFLGLIMVPTSTIYLAYGIKHDRSSDRLFYGLIIFFLGCGLFIGGVMP